MEYIVESDGGEKEERKNRHHHRKKGQQYPEKAGGDVEIGIVDGSISKGRPVLQVIVVCVNGGRHSQEERSRSTPGSSAGRSGYAPMGVSSRESGGLSGQL